MSLRDLISAFLKVFGLWSFLRVLPQLVGFIGAYGMADGLPRQYLVANAVYFVLLGAFSLACVFNTERIMRVLFNEVPDVRGTFDAFELQQTAFSAIGLIAMVWSGGSLLSGAAQILWYLGGERRSQLQELVTQNWSDYLHSLIATGLGVFVFVQAGWLARLSLRLRGGQGDRSMKITVRSDVKADPETVWQAWNDPEEIKRWNTASNDWHTTRSAVDLRQGGTFSSRMEAKDGSAGFDFEGTYTRVVAQQRIEYRMNDGRTVVVEFTPIAGGTRVSETFDAETENQPEDQRQGWQAILDNFARHVETKAGR